MPVTQWKEIVPEGEEARHQRHAADMTALQKKHARGGKSLRALHAKAHAGVSAKLEVLGNLPAHARYGLFAQPGTYDALVRFSNGAGLVKSDKATDVRGMAVKVLGVRGAKVIDALKDKTTQDFLAIQAPSTPFRDADEFMAFVKAADTPALLLFRLFGSVGPARMFQILGRLAKSAGAPVATMAGRTFYSAAAIAVGPYAARFAFEPLQAVDAEVPKVRTEGYLADDLALRLAKGPIAYDMKLQFFENEAQTPIEDFSLDWDAPFITVARLTVAQQNVASAEGQALAQKIEAMSFDPWHALVEHRPLGNMMRARKHTYLASIRERGASDEP